jgi:MSHA pilin protein MshC
MHYLQGMATPHATASRAERRAPRRDRGFTLLEITATLIIVGVLAAMLVTKFADVGEDATSATELLKARLRYTQMRSINNVSVHGIHSTGSSYWIFYNGDTGSHEQFPGESSDTVTLPSGVTMSSFTVSFDSRGIPYTDEAATAGSELTSGSAAASITVGGKAGAVRITPNTGYIPD